MIKQLFLLLFSSSLCAFQYVDFDNYMKTHTYASIVQKHNNQRLLAFFKTVYMKNQSTVRTREYRQRIPTIMHHVWFGDPLCDTFKKLRHTWLDKHQSWTCILWTDRISNDSDALVVRSFEELNTALVQQSAKRIIVLVHDLEFDNRAHFDFADNYGERSDILKWEIVYRYGGVYIDTDFECYKALDPLHCLFDFYTCLQPLDTGHVQLGAALFAAHPYHPILEKCVTTMRPGRGPIVIRTGPIHFTHACVKTITGCNGFNIVLPSGYFYPCGYEDQHLPESVWRRDESFAVHHWSGSWLKPEAFIKKGIKIKKERNK